MKRLSILIYSFVCISAAVAFAQDQSITYCDPQGDQKGPIPVYSDSRRAWVIENLACGQPVTFLAIEQGCAKIKIGDRIGYVDSRFIRYLQSPPELEKRVANPEKQIRGQQQPQTAEPTFHAAPASQPAEKSEGTQVTTTPDSEARGSLSVNWIGLQKGEGTQVTTTPDSEVRRSASVNWIMLPPSEAELQRRKSNEIEVAATERAAKERAAKERAAAERAAMERAATERAAMEKEERIAEQKRSAQRRAEIRRSLPPAPSARAMHMQQELEDLTLYLEGMNEALRHDPIVTANFVGTPSCTVTNLGGVMIKIESTGTMAAAGASLYGVELKGSANVTCTSDSSATQTTKTTSAIPFLGSESIYGDTFGRNGNFPFSVSGFIRCPGLARPTFFETPFEATVTLYHGLHLIENVFASVTVTCK